MEHNIDFSTLGQSQQQTSTVTMNQFFTKIYGWMFVGLAISAFMAYATLNTALANFVFSSPVIYYGFAAIQIALLLGIQFLIRKLSPALSRGLFFVYAALNGVTLAAIFFVYSIPSIMTIFGVAALMFACLAIIGHTTKKDLSDWGTFLFVGVIGVFFASIANIFLQSDTFSFVVSIIAVLVFAGLTVYDAQSYKNLYAQITSEEDIQRYANLGALHMYVNFIMIFVNLLQLFGNDD